MAKLAFGFLLLLVSFAFFAAGGSLSAQGSAGGEEGERHEQQQEAKGELGHGVLRKKAGDKLLPSLPFCRLLDQSFVLTQVPQRRRALAGQLVQPRQEEVRVR